ncbi:MAG: putative permease often clustered with de novo purine synthesis [Candidatus Jettenia ecosi]|uniref:Putative permease often clustered with de novo purine synthesis n=1 Tax=Candidatus Jettenia ecosi TaxID=2494326 RepID=A0A533Q6V5_9BACT|nr:MAG: putative permease often clustered with de novo purine synthesis [Candidatus Jettenia ecosi]
MEKEQKILDNIWIRVVLIGISIVIFLFLCYLLRGPLVSLLLAFIVAYIFNPVVNFFERKRWPFTRKYIQRGFGIVFLILAVLLFTSGFLAYAIPKTADGVYRIGVLIKERYPKYLHVFEGLIERYGDKEFAQLVKPILQEQIEKVKSTENEEQKKQEYADKSESEEIEKQKVKDVLTAPEEQVKKEVRAQRRRLVEAIQEYKKYLPQIINFFLEIIKNIFYGTFGFFSVAINFIIFSVVAIYLLKDFNIFVQKVKNIFPLPIRDKAMALLSKVNHNLRFYLRGQTITCLVLSFIYSIGLTITGIDLAFLVGFIGGFGNLIPYVGTAIGIFLASIIALFEFGDFKHLLYIIITFGVGQSLEATVITPRIMGKELSLHPAMVILAILIFGQLWGFLGLLLAVPIVATLKVFIDEVISMYKSSKYYTG